MSSAKGFSASPPFKAEWIDLLATSTKASQITPPRSGHTSYQVGGETFVFGGYVEEEQTDEKGMPNRHVVNDLWKWDKSKGWIVLKTAGDEVNPRLASASAVVNGKTPALFGGWDPQTPGTGGIILDDIVLLDTATNTWKCIENLVLPDGPTSRHVAVSLEDGRVLIHTHRCSDHVIIFEQGDDGKAKIYKQSTTGQAPSSRGLHAATMLPSTNKFLVTCGAAQDGSMSNEAFVLDTTTWQWTPIEMTTKEAPCPRASPCVCVLDSDSVVVFGGAARTEEGGLKGCNDLWLLTLNDNKGTWELLLKDGPPARNAATMDPIDPPEQTKKEGQYFLLHGGWEPFKKTWNDIYVLRVYKE